MAYAAVVCVAQILDQLLNTDIYGVDYPKPEVEYLFSKVSSLQRSLDIRYPVPKARQEEVDRLEWRIRELMYRVQDTIEMFISRRICDGEDNCLSLLQRDLEGMREELGLLAERGLEMVTYEPRAISTPVDIPRSMMTVGLEEPRYPINEPINERYWKFIEAQMFNNSTYRDILYLSYQYLPSRLKACFLYMATFQQDTDILVSKLLNLWVAEGFLAQPSPPQALEQVAKQHLDDLISSSLVSVVNLSSDGQPKSCRVHYTMEQCRKESFFHALKSHDQQQGTGGQRRMSVRNDILLCSEDVYECIASNKYARTLVYTGPNFHHPLPHFITFELLRVLDALSVYFPELPDSLFQLIHLRYLALTYDGLLPDSLSKLRNLMVLIVRQHPKIIFRLKSILPAAIWNLPQIRHLFFTESFLRYPGDARNNSVFFQNLQSLSNVNADCCTKEILQNMPNLKKLATWVERADVIVQLHLDQLQHLENFKFKVVKPIPGLKIEFQPTLAFPKTLRKLSLSGCGLPWEDMKVIAELSDLQVLKLRELAFQGQEWCIYSYAFLQLKFLLLESLDLETLDAKSSHFPILERLIIRYCYRLEEINADIGFIGSLKLIELVDCSPEAEDSVNAIREEQEEYGNEILCVRISSSKE